MRRDASRANGSVGEKEGGNNLNRCDFFETEKKMEICPHFGTRFYPQFCTGRDHPKNDHFLKRSKIFGRESKRTHSTHTFQDVCRGVWRQRTVA
jgi:hypothetical protein